jgi:hypothetical protein
VLDVVNVVKMKTGGPAADAWRIQNAKAATTAELENRMVSFKAVAFVGAEWGRET